MKMGGLYKRTLLIMLAMFGLTACGTSVLSAWLLGRALHDEYLSKGRAIAGAIAASGIEGILRDDIPALQSMIDQYLEISGVGYVYVTDAGGEVLAHTFVPRVPPSTARLARDPDRVVVSELSIEGRRFHDIARPILAGVAGYVHVGMDHQLILQAVYRAVITQQALLLALFVLCAGAMYLLVNRVSRPLAELTGYAERLSRRDFGAPPAIDATDEVGLLARTMVAMARQLGQVVDGLEDSVRTASSELTDTLASLESIIANLADGLLVVDRHGRITHANPALLAMLGFAPGTDLGGRQAALMVPLPLAELAEFCAGFGDATRTAEIALAGGRTGKAAGRTISRPAPGGAEEEVIGAAILIRDITTEKEVDRMKTEFISTVSHELRTPLTAILGFAKLNRKKLDRVILPRLPDDDPAIRKVARQMSENLDIVVAESGRLTELINDVLDISKMESGKVEWRMGDERLSELIAHAVAGTRMLFTEKGLAVRVEVEEGLPDMRLDRDRIIQVLINLLANAVKFTPAGEVTVKAFHRGDEVVVAVADTGVGIAPGEQAFIFERFKQAGDTLTEKPRGTGLGLPICKHIVESHGGRIWVESTPGKGSTFYFSLPPRHRPRG